MSAQPQLTSFHVRRAKDGDSDSLEWVIERFSPLLLAQARYRIGERLARLVDAEDVVQDAWAIALPRLPALAEADARATPAVVRFLSTTLLYRVNDVLRRRGTADEVEPPRSSLAQETVGPLERALRSESVGRLRRAIEELPERDRELVVLRAIEQRPNAEVAEALGLKPNTAAQAYGRALERLRERVGESVLDELV